MNKFRFTIKLMVIATFMLAFASMTQAQATRTWVSGVGDDANPCSRTAPCKTFAGAISKTATNGEIDALDPGGYGAVTITKGITIDGTKGAGFGSILASGTTGVIVNDTTNNGVVILRNLSINGASTTAGSGIRFLAGKALIVEDCQIFGFTGTGIGNAGSGIIVSVTVADRNVVVRDTSIQNCTVGIRLTSTTGRVHGTFDNVSITNPTTTSGSGVELQTGGTATFRDSYITRYTTGILVTGTSSGANLLRTTIQNTTTGINAGASTLRASMSAIMDNTTGVNLAGGTFRSGCDNFIENNTTDVNGGGITNACVR